MGTQKQLFIDDYVIGSIGPGVFQLLNQPLKYAGSQVHTPVPVIEMDRCWEADMHFGNSPNLIYDEEAKLFKMWNQAVNYDWSDNLLAYYVSKDGLHWEKPAVGQFDYHSPLCYERERRPTREHNFVFGKPIDARAPGVFKDLHEKDPRKRYKMVYNRSETAKGVWAAYSADGIHWTDYPHPEVNPIYLNNDTHHVIFWDPNRRKYVAHIRLWPPVFKDDPRFTTRRQVRGRVRTPGIATSGDFLHWDAPKSMSDPVEVNREYILLPPDKKDAPCTGGFYTFEALLYEGTYLAFPTPYHICPGMEPGVPPAKGTAQNPWLDTIDVQLAFSRDGKNWKRVGNRRAFIPNGPPRSLDGGMIFVAHQPVVREDLGEIWIYYAGFKKGHWAVKRGENQESAIFLAKLRLDGFVSLTAGKGSVTTKPLRFEGDRLRINAVTAGDEGSVYVEILDAQTNQALGEFGKDHSDVFRGDAIRHTVSWEGKSDLRALQRKTVKLRFHLQRAKLFSFQFYES